MNNITVTKNNITVTNRDPAGAIFFTQSITFAGMEPTGIIAFSTVPAKGPFRKLRGFLYRLTARQKLEELARRHLLLDWEILKSGNSFEVEVTVSEFDQDKELKLLARDICKVFGQETVQVKRHGTDKPLEVTKWS